MKVLHTAEIELVSGGFSFFKPAPKPAPIIDLSPSQLGYLTVMVAQSAVSIAAGSPAGIAAKIGVAGLQVLATAGANVFSNYYFPDSK
ncbi:hypothetical protein CC99x_003200 [Candidatus Berkiella cookevillensis]|uniref:Uncharacterized protein n=1 Tax=Candidatus Berkiella cookevillensis TaxID=437022 RepID=A0A0Q9YP00_9GAMM|nr:hypothetical protein [Candidatus Berkiella cookevillensis]MCS5707905.1 hypothetical protein [Candidatus Berkiella cookevillensis]